MDSTYGSVQREQNAKRVWLYRYILGLATVVFCGRAMPLAFMPIALTEDFGASDQTMGMTLSVYPLLALVSTPVVSRIARDTNRIVRLHTVAIWCLSFSMLLSSVAVYALNISGTIGAVTCVTISRASQGIGVSLYLSANTSLITRMFPEDLEYTIAMLEVMAGIGAQMGRIVGGFLYDLGGFALPFIVIASMQFIGGAIGLFFDEVPCEKLHSSIAENGRTNTETAASHSNVKWKDILTARMMVGALGPFFAYFSSGFYDTLLPQHLEDYLGPIPMSVVSSAMAIRSLSYMLCSFLLAKVLDKKLISLEVLLMMGSLFGIASSLLMAPQPWLVTMAFGAEATRLAEWIVQVIAFVIQPMGTAFLFVPSLPLMQSEARTHGSESVEKVAELFVVGMTSGEMMGPIVAGSLAGAWTFAQITLLLACLFSPYTLSAALSYDAKVIQRRARVRPEFALPSDGESNYAVRRILFALREKKQANTPWTEPASSFRRKYGHDPGSVEPKRSRASSWTGTNMEPVPESPLKPLLQTELYS